MQAIVFRPPIGWAGSQNGVGVTTEGHRCQSIFLREKDKGGSL